MQKEFNKLSIDKKHKFIIKNMLKDEYFLMFHYKIKTLFIEYITTKTEHKAQYIIKQKYIIDKITNILTNYKDNIIDLYCYPTSDYFYKKALYYKNKLYKMYNIEFLNYIDENNFSIMDLILDTWKNTKDILVKTELDLHDIIFRFPKIPHKI
jgi:hypothetical protein